jgi:hypothetical protein
VFPTAIPVAAGETFAPHGAPVVLLALTTIRLFLDRRPRIAEPRVIYGPSEQAALPQAGLQGAAGRTDTGVARSCS